MISLTASQEFSEDSRLRQLITEIGIPLKRLPEFTELSATESLRWWSDITSKSASKKSLSLLAKMLGFSESALRCGDFDKALARQRLWGHSYSLPEKYSDHQNSFVRTSEHIHRYLVLTRGQHFADSVLLSLNVSPSLYEHPHSPINLAYFADLLKVLSEKGLQEKELDTLASIIYLALRDRPLGQALQESQDFNDVYQTLSKNFHYFDSNFECRSEFIGKKYFLTTTLIPQAQETLKNDPEHLERILRYRMMGLAWVPFAAGLNPLFPKSEILSTSTLVRVRYEFQLSLQTRPQLTLLQPQSASPEGSDGHS